jgi:hypothetical protein
MTAVGLEGLAPRTIRALAEDGIHTLSQLKSLGPRDLARMPGIGPARRFEIAKLLGFPGGKRSKRAHSTPAHSGQRVPRPDPSSTQGVHSEG